VTNLAGQSYSYSYSYSYSSCLCTRPSTTKSWKFIRPPSSSLHGRFLFWSDLPSSASVRNQLDRASTSVPLNIAEGSGKFTSPDRCRFFDNARGSALESAACLDVIVAKRFASAAETQAGKAMLVTVVSMLFGLIRANSDVRVFEEPPNYQAEKAQKGEGQSENRKTNKTRSKKYE
jgi:four helix bundle protein